MKRRAYALPVVAMLALVGSIIVSAVFEYVSAQTRSVGRQLNSYDEHHMSRGLREVIGAWMQRTRSDNIKDSLDPEGRAMDLEFKDGSRITIWMRDGQGQALRDLSQVSGEELEDGRAVLRALAQGSDDEGFLRQTRAVGPVAVSALAADRELLTAIANALIKKGDPAEFVAEILSARDIGQLDRNRFMSAMNTADLAPEERTRIDRVLTIEPTVWRVEAELRRRDPRVPGGWIDDRYAGLAPLRRQRAASGRGTGEISTIFQPLGAFLTWERVERDTIQSR